MRTIAEASGNKITAPQSKMTKPTINITGSGSNNSSSSGGANNSISNNTNNINNNGNVTRKPRRSIKLEGNCLNGLLREGGAKVIDASKLGKRLSSEIWNSFGAIQVQENFTFPTIETKTVADGASTMKICQFFVACSKCFSVFKYDGHAYGTTGLVKHVKICQGTPNNQRTTASSSSSSSNNITFTSNNNTSALNHNLSGPHTSPTIMNSTLGSSTSLVPISSIPNGPITTRRKSSTTTNSKTRGIQPSIKHLAKVIEDLRTEQIELKQKINEMINLMGTGAYVGQIQIISNDGDKVEDALQK